MTRDQAKAQLAYLIDTHGLADVVELLAGVCIDKADALIKHDVPRAKQWDHASGHIGSLIAPLRRMVG